MKIPQLPKDWLVHSVDYVFLGEKNRWGERDEETITVNRVRVEPTVQYAINTQQEHDGADFVLYADGKHTNPLPDFEAGNQIIWQGKTYTIEKVLPFNLPDSPDLHHYELELI